MRSFGTLISLPTIRDRTGIVHIRRSISDGIGVRSPDRRCLRSDLPDRTLSRVRRWRRSTGPDLLNVRRRRRICRWRCAWPGLSGVRGRVRRRGCTGPVFAPRYLHIRSDGPGVRCRREVRGIFGDSGLAVLGPPDTTVGSPIGRSGLSPDRSGTRHVPTIRRLPGIRAQASLRQITSRSRAGGRRHAGSAPAHTPWAVRFLVGRSRTSRGGNRRRQVTAAPRDSSPITNTNRTVWGPRTGTDRTRMPCCLDMPGPRTTIR